MLIPFSINCSLICSLIISMIFSSLLFLNALGLMVKTKFPCSVDEYSILSMFTNNYVANAHCECLTDQCIRPHEGKRYEIDCGFWWWDSCGDGCRAYGGCRGACCKVQQDYCEGDNSCLSDRSCRGAETEEALALPIKNLDAMESANALSPKSTS